MIALLLCAALAAAAPSDEVECERAQLEVGTSTTPWHRAYLLERRARLKWDCVASKRLPRIESLERELAALKKHNSELDDLLLETRTSVAMAAPPLVCSTVAVPEMRCETLGWSIGACAACAGATFGAALLFKRGPP